MLELMIFKSRTQHCDLTLGSILALMPRLGLGWTRTILERTLFSCRRWLTPVITVNENGVLERLPNSGSLPKAQDQRLLPCD